MKFLSKAICCFSLQNLPHMQLAISLSFVKLLWPLVRFISYSHDQDHVHISTTYASTLEVSKISSINKIKLQVHVWHISLKNISRIWGYEKIKDAYPKKVCHMLRHVKKRESEIAPYPKRKKKERWCIQKEFTHHPPKIFTHLHILIKVYDLFLLWIRSLT